MRTLLPSLMLALTAPMIAMVAEARETGNIHGEVVDEGGLPVPNATVTLSGRELAGERTATTDDDGTYRFDGLMPGQYDLTVSFDGAVVAKAVVSVSLETTTWASLPIKIGGTAAEVDVITVRPAVDTTQTAFSTALDEGAIQNLPVGRSYQDVANTLPGVSGRVDTSEGGGGDGNPSVRGEGQYGNNFYIDGVSTRDPATKTFGMNVNFDAIEQVQVYTDGAPAEFGQFTGMVVNVVTKDGGDEHHGSAAVFYSQHAWFDREYDIFDPGREKEVPTTKAMFRSPNFAGTAGGPLIPEKLWYFTALDLSHDWFVPEGLEKKDAINLDGGNLLAKVTWFPTNALTLRYVFQGNLTVQLKEDASQFVAPEATTDRRDFSMSHLLNAQIKPDAANTLELRAGYTNINIDVVPSSGDVETPSALDEQGVLHENAVQYDLNDRNRIGGGFVYERFLEKIAGEHRIRLGSEYWYLIDQRDIRNTGEDTNFEWIDSNGNPTGDTVVVGTRYASYAGYPCEEKDFSDCGIREHWTNVGPLGNTVHTLNAFVQDDWKPAKQLAFNLGARFDMEDGRNDAGDRPPARDPSQFDVHPRSKRDKGDFGPLLMVAPRLGVAYDPWADGKTKFAGHYGQYYDLVGNNLWSWSNTRSADSFVRFVRDPATGEYVWSNTQDAVGHPLMYDFALRPARMDKVNIGIEREVADGLALGIRGILSRTNDIPEDVDTNLSSWYIMNVPIKDRMYRGIELTATKNFDDVWQVLASYTLQESYGHAPGQFELAPGSESGSDGNNVGVYLDDVGEQKRRAFYYDNGLGWILDGFKGLGHYSVTDPEYNDTAGYYGYLPYHSFHMIKLNGSYTAPFGTTFGLVYEFDSGHAWEKRTLVPFYGYDAFGEGRGSRFMPPVHYVDVRFAHEIGLGTEERSLEATLDIFNLPGFAQSITYFSNDAPGFGSTLYRQSPRAIRGGLKFRY